MNIGDIFKDRHYNMYIKIIDIGTYNKFKNDLPNKTNGIIIRYEKSSSIDFMVGICAYMKKSDFKRNYKTLTK